MRRKKYMEKERALYLFDRNNGAEIIKFNKTRRVIRVEIIENRILQYPNRVRVPPVQLQPDLGEYGVRHIVSWIILSHHIYDERTKTILKNIEENSPATTKGCVPRRRHLPLLSILTPPTSKRETTVTGAFWRCPLLGGRDEVEMGNAWMRLLRRKRKDGLEKKMGIQRKGWASDMVTGACRTPTQTRNGEAGGDPASTVHFLNSVLDFVFVVEEGQTCEPMPTWPSWVGRPWIQFLLVVLFR